MKHKSYNIIHMPIKRHKWFSTKASNIYDITPNPRFSIDVNLFGHLKVWEPTGQCILLVVEAMFGMAGGQLVIVNIGIRSLFSLSTTAM